MTKPIPTNNFEKDSSGKASRINEDNSRTPLVELQEDPSNPFDVEIKNTNTETSKSDETWYEVPQTAKGVIVQLNANGSGVSANVEYSLDREGVVAGSTDCFEKWSNGTVTNGVKSAEFPAVAGVRMVDIDDGEVKSTLSTDLVGENNDLTFTAKAIGVLGDEVSVKYTNPGTAVAEVKSSLSTNLAGDNNDLVYTSKLEGVLGDDITVAYIDPSAESQSLSIVVTGTDIVVNLATNDQNGGEITTTADDISAAIASDVDANALVSVADKADNNGEGVVTAMAETALTGGADEVSRPLMVEVDETDINVILEMNTSDQIVTTANDIITLIEGDDDAKALVDVEAKGEETGEGVVTALAKTQLAGGVDPIVPKLFITVI